MSENRPDYILLSATAILITLGISVLGSVSTSMLEGEPGQYTYFLFRQILVGLIPGFILGFIAFKISLSFFKKWIPILLLINLALMILVFMPKIGISSGGASRWIDFGQFFLQPSEFLKPFFIFYLAAWLSKQVQNSPSPKFFQKKFRQQQPLSDRSSKKSLLSFLIIIGFTSSLLILQPDVSTLGIIIAAAVIMYFLANTPVWHSVLIILMGTTALAFLIKTAPYRLNRLLVFLQPGLEPMGLGYQIKQALISIGSGGILGLGLGMGVQRFLPQPMSDSIFAVFAEETGFIGSLVLISVFLVFAWQGFSIAKRARDKFSRLTACGISSWITIQAFINIAAMVGILPLTGIPLPFISYGGSHIIAELIGVGILLNISKNTL